MASASSFARLPLSAAACATSCCRATAVFLTTDSGCWRLRAHWIPGALAACALSGPAWCAPTSRARLLGRACRCWGSPPANACLALLFHCCCRLPFLGLALAPPFGGPPLPLRWPPPSCGPPSCAPFCICVRCAFVRPLPSPSCGPLAFYASPPAPLGGRELPPAAPAAPAHGADPACGAPRLLPPCAAPACGCLPSPVSACDSGAGGGAAWPTACAEG